MRKGAVLMVFWLIAGILLTSGCGGGGDSATDNSEEKTSVELDTLEGKNELTSLEASALAYQEAQEWRSDAVLWYLNPMGNNLSEQWMTNDASFKWSVIFVNPKDDCRFNVTIEAGKIESAVEETHVKRSIPVPSGLPADRPGVAMNEAGKTVYANNPPSGKPMVLYIIENDGHKNYRGKPVWEFSFAFTNNGAMEACIYIVDGLNGELLEIMDAKGNPVDPPVGGAGTPQQDGKQLVEQFFESLGSGEVDRAMALMDKDSLGNASSKEMWKNSFDTLDGVSISQIKPVYQEEWTSELQKYNVVLSVHLKPGSQPMGWEEGSNTRWVSVKTESGQWKIHEIATNP